MFSRLVRNLSAARPAVIKKKKAQERKQQLLRQSLKHPIHEHDHGGVPGAVRLFQIHQINITILLSPEKVEVIEEN